MALPHFVFRVFFAHFLVSVWCTFQGSTCKLSNFLVRSLVLASYEFAFCDGHAEDLQIRLDDFAESWLSLLFCIFLSAFCSIFQDFWCENLQTFCSRIRCSPDFAEGASKKILEFSLVKPWKFAKNLPKDSQNTHESQSTTRYSSTKNCSGARRQHKANS